MTEIEKDKEVIIAFTGAQIEGLLFKDMVEAKEIPYATHRVKIEPSYELHDINGINVTAIQENKNDAIPTKVFFTLYQIEGLLFNEMILSKEIPPQPHTMRLDFQLKTVDDVTIIDGINAKAIAVKPAKKLQM